jgi:hypothetical protein
MDPGRCPECGTDVPPNRLARSPYAYKRYKEKLTVLAAVVIIVAFLYAFRDGLPGLLPTSLLYPLYGDGRTSAACELWWRYEKGSLSASQKVRLLDLAIEWPEQLYVESPYPSGASLEAETVVDFHVRLGTAVPVGRIDEGAWELRVDGALLLASPPDSVETMARSLGIDTNGWGMGWLIPPLQTGEHEIAVRQEFHLVSLEGTSEKRVHTWNVSAFGVVTVQDPPIDELYVPILDEGAMRQVERAFQLSPEYELNDPRRPALGFRFEAPPVRITSSAWARVTGDDVFYPVVEYVSVSPGESKRGIIRLHKLPGIESATHVDVRLTPFPMGADIIPKNRRYYGRIIERLAIPLPDPPAAGPDHDP